MSQPQRSNNKVINKIAKDTTGKSLESTTQCCSAPLNNRTENVSQSTQSYKRMIATHSDGSIIKTLDQTGLKQKFVNKVKSWSSKDSKGFQGISSTSTLKHDSNVTNIISDFEELNLGNNISEDNMTYQSDLLRAKDSLENLINSRTDKAVSGDDIKSKSYAHSLSQDKRFSNDGPYSDSSLGRDTVGSSRVLTWDPWNKVGRKNKKENKFQRRKAKDKSPSNSRDTSHSPFRKSMEHTVGDEPREADESYEYQPYRPNRKSVDFMNEVLVVYFTGEEVITKGTEPLKKELDQQIRNKEMRRGHVPCTMVGKQQFGGEDCGRIWLKK